MVLLRESMIDYVTGDILTANAEALVKTVNCVGVMGRGIALQFKNAFPENYKAYVRACELEEVQPGRMFVFENNRLHEPKYLINFPTKRHWKGKSRLTDIDSGLVALKREIEKRNIHSIAIPPLGSGLGGLNWSDVKPRIEAALSDIPNLHMFVYEPKGAPTPQEMISSKAVPKMTSGRAALVVLMERYLSGLLDPFVTLLEVHKLMYFMQEAGEPLKLQYAQANYGPYAENLRHVLRHVEGHLISGYADGGDAPDKQLELVPGAIEDAQAFLKEDTDTRGRFDRVAALVDGFETPYGLELLSTVHWVATRLGATTLADAIRLTHDWNERKRQFTERQIGLAYRILSDKGWIQAQITA
jgi:O-acetyl-ADP-ribose deacetylase (regulator of RNase III)